MLLSICKEITYLASVYPSISIRFLKAAVNVGFQSLSYLPPALCILHLSRQKIPFLLWAFALCVSVQVETYWLSFMEIVFLLVFLSVAFLECKIKVRQVETFSLAAGRYKHDLQCITVS